MIYDTILKSFKKVFCHKPEPVSYNILAINGKLEIE